MKKCTLKKLRTSAGEFYLHHYRGKKPITLVLIPGLMEPKAGLCYIWQDIALYFEKLDISVILVDLAGQGDSMLPFSFDLWKEQIESIYETFKHERIIFIGRGLGSYLPFLVDSCVEVIAVGPPDFGRILPLVNHLRMVSSPITPSMITITEPNDLKDEEKLFWSGLGAEIE